MTKVGILHPGLMGISVAACVQAGGHEVYWVSHGRSPATRARAEQHLLAEVSTLGELCEICEVIVSVCPPHAAEEVAAQVVAEGFRGMYLEANAISPMRTERIGAAMTAAGIAFVDGGIIGPPAWTPGETRLYLSGERAGGAAELFKEGILEVSVIGEAAGKASALKMCYAAYTKGSTALLCAILGAAERLGVRHELDDEWAAWGDFPEQTRQRARRVTAKAWRFEGEMEEIAATFAAADMPDGFHKAAAQIYHRLASFKDAPDTPLLEDVLEALARGGIASPGS